MPAAPEDVVEVGVVTLAARPVTTTSEMTGRVVARIESEVRPQVDGIVLKRTFVEGAIVHAGQPLYLIDPRPYLAARDQAASQLEGDKATLADDETKYRRYESLSDPQAVSAQDRDDTRAAAVRARATVDQDRAALASAQINLRYTRVLAPITGRTGRSSVTAGALVSAAQTTPLAVIRQLDPIHIDVTQSSTQLLQLRRALSQGGALPPQARARLILEDGTSYAQSGVLQFTESAVDEDAGTVVTRALFPNPDGLLLPGMLVRVEVPQATLLNGILVPQQGVTRDARGNARALVVERDNKVAARTLVADRAIGSNWLVSSGLRAGDRLIVEGSDKVSVGATVKPVQLKAGS